MKTVSDTVELTDILVKQAACPQGRSQHFIRDLKQRGLALRLRSSGGKSFVVFTTRPGMKGSHKVTIGQPGKLSLASARKKAAAVIGTDGDVIAQRRAQKEADKQAAQDKVLTLSALLKEGGPYEIALKARSYKNTKTALSSLRRHLLLDCKSIDIRRLERRNILDAMDKLEAAGKTGAAHDLRKHAGVFLGWCTDTRHYTRFNVMSGYRKPKQTNAEKLGLVGGGKRTKRALSDDEIRQVWIAGGGRGSRDIRPLCALLPARRHPPL